MAVKVDQSSSPSVCNPRDVRYTISSRELAGFLGLDERVINLLVSRHFLSPTKLGALAIRFDSEVINESNLWH